MALAYVVLSKGLNILIQQAGVGTQAILTITEYLSFVTLMLVVFGAAFELPLLVVMANLAGVLPAIAAEEVAAHRRLPDLHLRRRRDAEHRPVHDDRDGRADGGPVRVAPCCSRSCTTGARPRREAAERAVEHLERRRAVGDRPDPAAHPGRRPRLGRHHLTTLEPWPPWTISAAATRSRSTTSRSRRRGARGRVRRARLRADRRRQDGRRRVRRPPRPRRRPEVLLHDADQGAVEPEVQRPRRAPRAATGRPAHRRQLGQRRRPDRRDDDRGAAQHALRRQHLARRPRLRRDGRGALSRRPVPRRRVGGSDHPPARVGSAGQPVRHREQRRGVRRVAGVGARRDQGDRPRGAAGAAVAAHARRPPDVRPLRPRRDGGRSGVAAPRRRPRCA